ncbi:MAG: ankyrin [Candidatus Aminicenantes bacterium]|nr:ankyrin [Candidatus Aminicenantes bacterium]
MRDVNGLPGLHAARTMFSAKKRSIPRVQSSVYLDLFMLGKEKERLLKDDERQCRLREINKKRLEDIDLEVNRLQGVDPSAFGGLSGKSSGNPSFSGRTHTQRNGVKKEWKKMTLNY